MEIEYFDKIMDKYIKSETWKRKIGRYYPSEVGSCMRKIFYNILIPKDKDPKLQKVFAVGTIIHNFIAEVIKSDKTADEVHYIADELPFLLERDGYVISGRIDDLFILRHGTKIMLTEVKSTKNIEWIKTKNKPSENHKDQLTLYMYAMGISNGTILYVEKNTLDTAIFEVEYDAERVKKILKKFDDIHYHLSNHILPPKEAQENKDMQWQCRFCEFRKECREDYLPPLESEDNGTTGKDNS